MVQLNHEIQPRKILAGLPGSMELWAKIFCQVLVYVTKGSERGLNLPHLSHNSFAENAPLAPNLLDNPTLPVAALLMRILGAPAQSTAPQLLLSWVIYAQNLCTAAGSSSQPREPKPGN